MAWTDEKDHPFDGIARKLERADENIVNLHSEITQFFEACEYPVLPEPYDEPRWQQAVDYHKNLQVPKRFSVLTGEIVHHLRSCLDHIVWHFSSPGARRDHENALEFPVFRLPMTKDEGKRFKRKIQGISSNRVLALIEELQPYHGGDDAINHPICIVHDMDRFDKHRELVIVTSCANIVFPKGTSFDVIASVMTYREGKILPEPERIAAQRAIKNDAKVFPQVAFAQLGRGDAHFVVPALAQLLGAITDVVELFAREI
jgi:hypothetical protein